MFAGLPNQSLLLTMIKSVVDSDEVFIGQTSRALRSMTREHKRAIFTGDNKFLLTQQCIKNNHDFALDNVNIIDRCSQWSKRLF